MAKISKTKKTISKTKIKEKAKRKTNLILRNTILELKKSNAEFWKEVARLLAMPRRKSVKVNLEKINKIVEEDDVVLVPGKVLGKGFLEKQITLSCFSISKKAREILEKSNSRLIGLLELYKKNKSGGGIKIIN